MVSLIDEITTTVAASVSWRTLSARSCSGLPVSSENMAALISAAAAAQAQPVGAGAIAAVILVPVLLSLLAIPAFVIFLRRRGEPGGWRTVKDAEMDKPEEAWWEQEESS